ncbi:MAG: hypothetical protein DLM52_13425, partial [Chthoniobacterales bacterium]
MIGLLFGELKRLRALRRVWLVLASVGIALFANFVRVLFLVSVAFSAHDVSPVDRWHDLAGYAILLLVFAGTMWLAARLGKDEEPDPDSRLQSASSFQHPAFSKPALQRLSLVLLFWFIAIELATEMWYRAHERNLIAAQSWSVAWPSDARGFRDLDIDEGVRRTLRFDHGREATWPLLPSTNGKEPLAINEQRSRSCVAFFFRWNSGGSTVLRARAHRPDICLPDAGWQKLVDRGEASYAVNGVTLPFRRVSFRKKNNPGVAQTYFCLQEDARHPLEDRPDLLPFTGTQPEWSMAARVRVVREGIRNLGQQVLEIVLFENG